MSLRPRRNPRSSPDGAGANGNNDDTTADANERNRARRTRSERIYLALFFVTAGIIGLSILWILATGLLARERLESAQTDVKLLKRATAASDFDKADQLTARIAELSASAHQLTSGPAWWVGSNLPLVGTPLRTSRVIATQADRIGRTAPRLVRSASKLTASRSRGAGINLPAAQHAVADLRATTRVVGVAQLTVSSTPGSWLPLVSNARNRLADELNSITPTLDSVQRASGVILPMLGATRPQRYFVGFMNEAESRGLGGLAGAYAILTVDHGKLSFSHFGNNADFAKVRSGVDLGPEYAARYGQDDPENTFTNSDISPDFRDAARIWAGSWHAKTGQDVDGAIVTDPTTLGYLLAVTGPAVLPNGSQVSADNVVGLTQKAQYSKFSVDAERNAYLNEISAAVAAKLVSTGGEHPVQLLAALRRGVSERRLAIWSANAATEDRIIDSGFGAVLQSSSAFTGFTVVNAAGSKLDYYLRRTMRYQRSQCTNHSSAVATLTLTNDAPTSGLPAYVTTRADDHPNDVRPGDNRVLVTYYASVGATVTSVRVDGQPVAFSSGAEKGLTATTIDLELPVGRARTVLVTVIEPAPTSPLTVLRQPLVKPLITKISDACEAQR